MVTFIFFIIVIVVIFWLFVIRAVVKRSKARAAYASPEFHLSVIKISGLFGIIEDQRRTGRK